MRSSTSPRPLPLLAAAAAAFLAGVNAQNATVSLVGTQTGTGTVASGAVPTAAIVGNATSSAVAAAATAANPLIPTTVSAQCQTFLSYLNGQTEITACTTQALATLSAFVPSLSQSALTASSDEVTSALTTFCSTGGCSSAAIRQALTYFSGNCSSELAAGTDVILSQYDTLYVLTPLTQAICTQDSQGAFCINDIVNGSVPASAAAAATTVSAANATSTALVNSTATANTTANSRVVINAKSATWNIATYAGDALNPQQLFSAISGTASRFARRAGDALIALSIASVPVTLSERAATTGSDSLLPNAGTWSTANVPFLFLSPNMTSTVLCTSCTKSILAGYIAWETASPYALGLANSPLLKGQGALWSGVGQVCGSGFLASTNQQAGQSSLTSAAGGLAWGQPSLVGGAVAVVGVLASFVL